MLTKLEIFVIFWVFFFLWHFEINENSCINASIRQKSSKNCLKKYVNVDAVEFQKKLFKKVVGNFKYRLNVQFCCRERVTPSLTRCSYINVLFTHIVF